MSDTKEPKASILRNSPRVSIYTDRREWLVARVGDKRAAWDTGASESLTYYGLANTEHQFREALCEFVFPSIRRLAARDIQQAMADELASMGAAK